MNLERQTQAPSLETMVETALDTLQRGNDMVWSWWLRGGNYIELAVVCCPNRDEDVPCPTGRTDDEGFAELRHPVRGFSRRAGR